MSFVSASHALQEVAKDLQSRFEIGNKRAESTVAEGKSLEGVNALVESFDQIGQITR